MGLFDFLSKQIGVPDRTSKKRKRASGPQEEILDGVEQAIKLLVPQILRVSGYRKRLAPAVERTMSYADEVVGQIPGPVEYNSANSAWNRGRNGPRFSFGVRES